MKIIQWDEISDQDLNLISLIVERVKSITAKGSTLALAPYPLLHHDLSAYHLASPLRLDDLLKAPVHDLLHDIHGIYISLNRTTGQPRGCFTPRFIFKLSEEQEAEKLGHYLIGQLTLRVSKKGRVDTRWGGATPLDLGLFVKRIVEEKPYLEG